MGQNIALRCAWRSLAIIAALCLAACAEQPPLDTTDTTPPSLRFSDCVVHVHYHPNALALTPSARAAIVEGVAFAHANGRQAATINHMIAGLDHKLSIGIANQRMRILERELQSSGIPNVKSEAYRIADLPRPDIPADSAGISFCDDAYYDRLRAKGYGDHLRPRRYLVANVTFELPARFLTLRLASLQLLVPSTFDRPSIYATWPDFPEGTGEQGSQCRRDSRCGKSIQITINSLARIPEARDSLPTRAELVATGARLAGQPIYQATSASVGWIVYAVLPAADRQRAARSGPRLDCRVRARPSPVPALPGGRTPEIAALLADPFTECFISDNRLHPDIWLQTTIATPLAPEWEAIAERVITVARTWMHPN